jgi:hypothetical protein
MAATNYTPIQLYNSGTTGNAPSAGNLAAGELAINYTDGKLFYKDNSAAVQVIAWKTTPTTAGGTGLTSYTAGDLLYYASGTTLSKLAIGSANYVLTSSGSAPQYVAQSTLSVGSATNATNTAITDNTSSSSTWYPTIVSSTSGNLPQTTSSTQLSFVPSTGILTATGFNGAHNGTVGATTANTGAFTSVTATSVTATGEIKDQTATRVQYGTVAYSCSSGPSGGFYYNRYTITFPYSFKSGTLPSVTFSNLQPGFYPTTVANCFFFMESTQTQSNTQFTVTAVSALTSQSGTIQWTAIGTAP